MERNPQKKRKILLSRESEGEPARALPVPTSTPRNTEAALWRDMTGWQPQAGGGTAAVAKQSRGAVGVRRRWCAHDGTTKETLGQLLQIQCSLAATYLGKNSELGGGREIRDREGGREKKTARGGEVLTRIGGSRAAASTGDGRRWPLSGCGLADLRTRAVTADRDRIRIAGFFYMGRRPAPKQD